MNRFYRTVSFIGGVYALNFAMAACSGGESTASANTGGASSTGTGVNSATGSGGGGACGCPAPTEYDVTDFVKLNPSYPTWAAVLPMPNRTPQSLFGAQAYGITIQNRDPFFDDKIVPIHGLEVIYRDGALVVALSEIGGADKVPIQWASVHFVVPPAP